MVADSFKCFSEKNNLDPPLVLTGYAEKFKGTLNKGGEIILQLFKKQNTSTHYYKSCGEKL